MSRTRQVLRNLFQPARWSHRMNVSVLEKTAWGPGVLSTTEELVEEGGGWVEGGDRTQSERRLDNAGRVYATVIEADTKDESTSKVQKPSRRTLGVGFRESTHTELPSGLRIHVVNILTTFVMNGSRTCSPIPTAVELVSKAFLVCLVDNVGQRSLAVL
ncbi:hypothetical protein BaRGS_00033106, partial [Batillaria attramentaria]